MRISSEEIEDWRSGNNVRNGELAKLEELSTHKQSDDMYIHGRKQSLRARYVYGFIFFATNLLAWFFRDYGAKFLQPLQSKYISKYLCKHEIVHLCFLMAS